MEVTAKTLLITLVIAFTAAGPFVHAAEKPNVVLMLADNLGFGDFHHWF